MTEAQTADAEVPQMTPAEQIAELTERNAALEAQLDQLRALETDRESRRERLAEQAAQNARLRKELAARALDEAVRIAAENVGVSPQWAMLNRHLFQCRIGDDGTPAVTPNPTEYFLKQVRQDPSLANFAEREKARQRTDAAVDGLLAADRTDPVELMTALDASPARTAGFIDRHGRQKYLQLAAAARRKGYVRGE